MKTATQMKHDVVATQLRRAAYWASVLNWMLACSLVGLYVVAYVALLVLATHHGKLANWLLLVLMLAGLALIRYEVNQACKLHRDVEDFINTVVMQRIITSLYIATGLFAGWYFIGGLMPTQKESFLFAFTPLAVTGLVFAVVFIIGSDRMKYQNGEFDPINKPVDTPLRK